MQIEQRHWHWWVLTLVGASLLVTSCAFIEFEEGAYVVRDLQAVYSQQENLTFLSWKLREDANLKAVDFELYRDGGFRQISLGEAPFAADPYECDGDKLCFQYQIPGRYRLPDERTAIRTLHNDQGIFSGEPGDFQSVEVTVGTEPVAVANNERIEPRVVDWFEENGVPLRRSWQWQLVEAGGSLEAPTNCKSSVDGQWKTVGEETARSGRVDVDYGWVQEPACLAVRPDGDGIDEVVVRVPLSPSAETAVTRQSYTPERIDAPIYYGVLMDMSIQNSERCERVRSELTETISQAMRGEGSPEKMGGYRPISPDTGEALDGCDQVPGRTYPIETMIQDAAEIDGRLAPRRVRFVFIYINNSPLPLAGALRESLRSLVTELGPQNDLALSNWAIGSNRVVELTAWNRQVGWRPISSDTFLGQISSVAAATVPFATMDHTDDTDVPIEAPEEGPRPRRFKVCRSTPRQVTLGTNQNSKTYTVDDPSIPWPEGSQPYFEVSFPPQILVPAAEYVTRRVDLVIEVCRRFCSHRFKSQGGGIYESWSQTSEPQPLEVCKWRP